MMAVLRGLTWHSRAVHFDDVIILKVRHNNTYNLYWHIKKILHTQKHNNKNTEPIKHKTDGMGRHPLASASEYFKNINHSSNKNKSIH